MTVNISAQTIALTIGSQNWSAWIESIQIGYGEYEMGSGLMPCNGTINLIFPANYAGIPSNPEYRFNSSQWRRGQLVQIAVGGAALPCSGNALKILKPPQRPNRDQSGIARMALSVGCALAYNYFPPEPNDDFSGITAGNPVTFGVIINSVLSRLGIPTSVNVGNYQINYPLPKIEGNWLDFCGQLADNAGWYLRCDTNGTVISEWITDEGSSGVTYTIGTDESDWTAIGDVGETPVEKLIVTGIKKTLEPVSTAPNVVIEEQPIGFLMPDIEWSQPTAISLTISKRTTTNRSRTLITSTVLETIEEPLGVILPDLGFNQPTSISLGISKKTTTKTFFDDGTITKTIETIEQPLGVILPDLGLNQPTSISLGISKRTTRQWTKIGNQKYREEFTEEQPLGVTFPDLGFNQPTSISLGIIKETTTEGESAPPTDQPISDFNLTEEQIKSEIYAAQLAVSEGRDRQRTISLPYAVNESQLTAYGIIFNKILVGRAFGWRFATRLNTALLPMRTVSIIDGTQGYILRMDAMQWAMTQTEAYIVFNGIEDGVFAAATPNDITFPVSFPIVPIAMILIPDWSVRQNLLGPAPMILQANWTALFNEISGLFRLIPDWVVTVPSTSSLLAYWKLDETGGDTVNRADSVGSYALVPSTNASLTHTTGKIGNALQFPTATGIGIAALTDGATKITKAFWFKAPSVSTGGSDFLITRYPENAPLNFNVVEIEVEPEVFAYELYFVGGETFTSAAFRTNVFCFIVLYFDIATTTISVEITGVNAAGDTTITQSGTWTSTASTATDMQLSNSIIDFTIDEFGLWNRELTAPEKASLYNGGAGVTYPSVPT